MKQQVLNAIMASVGIVILIIAISVVFGITLANIFSFIFNLAVYLFLMVGFQIALPIVIGWAARKYAISALDRSVEEGDAMPDWIHVLLAVVLGLLIGGAWMWLTPHLAFIPSVSVWPVEFLRWLPSLERLNLWHAVWPAIGSALFYIISHLDKNGDE